MPASTKLVLRETPALESKIGSIGGSRSDVWNDAVLDSLQMAIPNLERLPQEVIERKSQAMLDALMSLKPGDEIEGMVMAQMIAIQEAIMECFRRAWGDKQHPRLQQDYLNQAGKLSRTYTRLLDALNKHRGKGQQKMIVEHVNIRAGGQAVVGNVER